MKMKANNCMEWGAFSATPCGLRSKRAPYARRYVPVVVILSLFSWASMAQEDQVTKLLNTLRDDAVTGCYRKVNELNLWSEAIRSVEDPGEIVQARFAGALSRAIGCAAELSQSSNGVTYHVTKDLFGSGYSLSKDRT